MLTINQLLAKRIWFVPGLVVWGTPGLSEITYLTTENVNGDISILYGSAIPGGARQTVLYADLTDHRGNSLPATLAAPRVIVRPHGPDSAFVVGAESPASVTLARDPDSAASVSADLIVIEMGD